MILKKITLKNILIILLFFREMWLHKPKKKMIQDNTTKTLILGLLTDFLFIYWFYKTKKHIYKQIDYYCIKNDGKSY